MNTEPTTQISLFQALLQWSDQYLVDAVRTAERPFTFMDLSKIDRPQLTLEADRPPQDLSWRESLTPAHQILDARWRELERDFKLRLTREEFFLEGVEVTKEMDAEAQANRGALATEYDFNFLTNSMRFRGSRRFVNITASQTPGTWAAVELPLRRPARLMQPSDVIQLDDETLMALLQENARRVVAQTGAKLFEPGRVSFMPLVRGKMLLRAKQNELLDEIGVEAEWLAAWVASKVTLLQVPTAPTIKKTLSKEYKLLKARSKAAIQISPA